MTRTENEKTWGIAYELAEEYMFKEGNDKAKQRFRKLKREAVKVLNALPKRIREETEYNLETLKFDEKYFYQGIQKGFAAKIRKACMGKVAVRSKETWNEYIVGHGGFRNIFNHTCREIMAEYDIVPRIYMDAFINAYLHKEQKEVFEILVALPEKMLEKVNVYLNDTWDYTIHVRNGRLVVHDHD